MDSELVVRAQHGDREAFAALADASLDRFLSVAQGILGDTRLAEDATQQALLDIWRNLPRLREAECFEGWSYRLVVNACYSEVRRSRRWMPDVITPLPAAAKLKHYFTESDVAVSTTPLPKQLDEHAPTWWTRRCRCGPATSPRCPTTPV